MELNELTSKLNECLDHGNRACFSKEVEELLANVSEERAASLLSEYLFNRYTSHKADSIAGLLEIILRKNVNLGSVNFPDNNFLRVAILRGSNDLFDCYLEEFCTPYLESNKKIDEDEFYIDLLATVDRYLEKLDNQEQPVIKGMHFNGAYGQPDDNPNAVVINRQDYEIMNDTVEKYNTLVGRKAILNKLNQIIDTL